MWGYPKILELGKQCKDVDELAKEVETLFCPEEVFSSLNSSFERLCQYEQGIKISDFIQEEYRERRLFNTPDHPTTFCYQYVANKIAEEIGVRLSASFQNLNEEIQPLQRLPIIPAVSQELNLKFKGSELLEVDVFGNRSF